ncbi:hypothetical protein [Methylobacterium longum]|uniref:Uncharacterized protein n=1 Tax=Methylobacterium longum TaxID=767694 RepID=A0ABT8AST7_9HYPH|nr:hypothetical protein [Methylobacterium longum]MDN3572805.1 hypothetical protein [Methylobacterium longum]
MGRSELERLSREELIELVLRLQRPVAAAKLRIDRWKASALQYMLESATKIRRTDVSQLGANQLRRTPEAYKINPFLNPLNQYKL